MNFPYTKLMIFIIFLSICLVGTSVWIWFSPLFDTALSVKVISIVILVAVYAIAIGLFVKQIVAKQDKALGALLHYDLQLQTRDSLLKIDGNDSDSELVPEVIEAAHVGKNASTLELIAHRQHLLSTRLEDFKYQLDYDCATGLRSRRYIDKVITARISADQSFSLVLFKIENYHLLTELYGANIVSECVQVLASRLRNWELISAHFTTDTLLLCADILLEDFQVETLYLMLSQPVEHELINVPVTLRASVVDSSVPAMSADELYAKLDITLFEAEKAKSDYLFYEQQYADNFTRKNEIIAHLHSSTAYQHGEFSIVYQPIVALQDNKRLIGTEALIRWHNRSLGDISPYSFISLARQAKLIDRITSWLTQHIVLDLLTFRRAGHHFPISFNVGNVDKSNIDIFVKLNEMLKSAGLSAADVIVEIGEDELQQSDDDVSELLHKLSEYGYKLAIDDIGKSSISLVSLTSLPISTVKIDNCLVTNMTVDSRAEQCTRAIIRLANTLGLTTIAVGVENSQVADLLTSQGCDAAQGYYFTKPLEMRELVEWLGQQSQR